NDGGALDDLAAGATATASALVTISAPGGSTVTNVVTATGHTSTGGTITDTSSATVTVNPNACTLSITCPDAATVECSGGQGTFNFPNPSVSDTCGGGATITSTQTGTYLFS